MRYIILLFFLSACTLYPPYDRPEFDPPQDWRTSPNTCCAVEANWWMQFGDEVLDDLIEMALDNNQDLLIAMARVDQFQAQLGIACSRLYPQLELDGLAERKRVADSTTALPSEFNQIFNVFGFIFKASYFVDLWGEVRSNIESAGHELISSIEERRLIVLSLVSAVADAYIQLRQFDEQFAISSQTYLDRQEALYLAKVRYELGLTSEIQVEQAISVVEIAKAEMEKFQLAIAETENLISVLIGVPSTSIQRGLPLDSFCMPRQVPAYLPCELIYQRPDIIAAEEKLIAANARIGVARAQFLPQLTLTGQYGQESSQLKNLLTSPATIWQYGASLLQEIFTGGRLTAQVQLTIAEKQELLHQYLSTVLNAYKEVNDALISHRIQLELVKTQGLRVKALKEYLHLANLRYQEGETDYLTYLDAERQLFRGMLSLEEAKGNSFLSLVAIYQALGGGWVIDADDTALENFCR